MNACLLSSIRRQSVENPTANAVYDDGQYFSYIDLELSANRLANYLRNHKVEKNDIVILYLRRSCDVLISILATWKTGATYLCLDYETPSDRLISVIEECQPKCVVTEPALSINIPKILPTLTCQDNELFHCGDLFNTEQPQGEDIAYLISTSGSTGKPKNVLITHKNLANYIFWFNQHFEITQNDIFSFCSSPAFDFAVTCLHTPIVAGAQILITSESTLLDVAAYMDQLVTHRVTFVKWTPSYFKLLLSYVEKYKPDLSCLRYLMIAGEELLTSYLERWFKSYPSHTFINEYGPTETTVGITTHVITKPTLDKASKTVSIGQPIDNVSLYVVDANGRLLPQGEIGELWVGGTSVGAGYYKSSALTQKSFIKNPFSSEKSSTLYKTGDLVKQLPDGNYHYIARIDKQVKINGYRVEMSEVEHHLLQQTEVDQACILVEEDKEQGKYLVAYVVLTFDSFDQSIITKNISKHLPKFMLPKRYYIIDHVPLTANGKVDYAALVTQGVHPRVEEENVI